MKDKEMLNAATKILSQVGEVELEEGNSRVGDNADRVDSIASVRFGRKRKRVGLEFKPTGEPRAIAEFVGRLGDRTDIDYYPIFIAPFIGERGREMCQKSNIGCVDLSGNVYLRFDDVFIDLWNNENKFKIKREQKRLLSPKSTWVIRSMLSSPNKKWTMQELSNDSGASLAQVYKVLDALQTQDYVVKNRGAIGLKDPPGLLTLWATNYKFNEQKITGYYSPIKGYDQIFSELRKISDKKYALTLGAAAQLVLPVVRSTDVYVYAEVEDELKKTLQLEPVEFGGNVYLVIPKDDGIMKGVRTIDGVKLVSNIQLFLDLYNYPQRGREQADAIREKLLGV